MSVTPPPNPLPRLALGITGHRDSNPGLAANRAAVSAAIGDLFGRIETNVRALDSAKTSHASTRLHNLLVSGVDIIGAEAATALGWELVAPLPFGEALNCAINSLPTNLADAEALLAGREAQDPDVQHRAASIRQWTARTQIFALADRDNQLADLFRARLAAPGDISADRSFSIESSDQAALAGQVMIEQSDLLIAVWDGQIRNLPGGTGHTVGMALEEGSPVLLLDPNQPGIWRLARARESLATWKDLPALDDAMLAELVRDALQPDAGEDLIMASERLDQAKWRGRSSYYLTIYRRIEAIFGGQGRPFRSLRQTYETPDQIAAGSGSDILGAAAALPGGDPAYAQHIADQILPRFAWSDGIGAWLSDAYRSGMITNFMLSALAIMIGLAYQPLHLEPVKWIFATGEFLLLAAILFITWLGSRLDWHARWFETRRVAEYLRHAPILLLLGVARAPGRWPRGADTTWPEYHARHCLRAAGLPRISITKAYLIEALETVLHPHVVGQRDYHRIKAARLETVHLRLDKLSQAMFLLAVLSVSTFLGITLGAKLGLIDQAVPEGLSHLSTFVGVSLPTLGASIAGMRFFGDFERFAAISEVTAEKLDGVDTRIRLLLAGGEAAVDYAAVAELAHRIDEIVVDEIESWQAVFGGKHLSLPA
ncbi:MAG: hypothetical protein ABL914_05695 [Novosphingobium sp.]|uniref:hypothetical protein n=1 Tax=Novosphingobium sp. TaxID=1874826 RepID=UPI0032BBC910